MDDDQKHTSLTSIAASVARWRPAPPVVDEFFRPGHFSEIPLVLLHDRVIGQLSELTAANVGLDSSARDVKVAAEVQCHIFKRRLLANVNDVMMCLNRLEEAFANLTYFIDNASDPFVYEVVGALAVTDRYVRLPIKLVQAGHSKSGADELWLRTALPWGRRTLLRYRRQGKIREFRTDID